MSDSGPDGVLRLATGGLEVALWEDSTYTRGSTDNASRFAREIVLADRHCKAVEIRVRDDARMLGSAVLLVPMWCSGPREGLVIARDGALYLGAGDEVVALAIPSLEVLWRTKADHACVFGLQEIEGEDALLVHGELEITRLGLDGRIQWQRGGRDIFTGGCVIDDDEVIAIDWDGAEYRWRLSDGEMLVGPHPLAQARTLSHKLRGRGV
jgi:hypothetical protein